MMDLTLREMIILIAAIVLIISLLLSILKHSIRIAIVVLICSILFSGFTWLPEKIKEWTSSDQMPQNVNEVVNTVKDEWDNYVGDEGQTWIDSAKSLWEKIVGPKTEQPEQGD